MPTFKNKKKIINAPSGEDKISDKEKLLSEMEQEKGTQLTLFEMLLPNEKSYSNTFELYDFMPKWFWGKVKRVNNKYLDTVEREFEYRKHSYRIQIRPASIINKNGEEKYYFPGKREELVEEALRKLVVSGKGVMLDGNLGVVFTLYQLQNELSRNKHTYSTDELKDSIRILNDIKITLITEDGKETGFHPIESYGFAGEEDQEKTFVKFSPWITNIIKKGNFRLFNYETVMTYSTVIARQLHKRFSHHHVTASITKPFNIKLSTIIRDFGLTRYERLSNNIREVEKALDEMKEKDVLIYYKTEKKWEFNGKKKTLADATFYLTPSFKFESEIIRANKRQKDNLPLISE